MIRIFIPTYNRYNVPHFTTAWLLEQAKVRYTLVLRDNHQRKLYLPLMEKLKYANYTMLPKPGSIDTAREYIRTLLRPNEWCLMMDDNIRGFYVVDGGSKLYHRTGFTDRVTRASPVGRKFNVLLPFKEWYEVVVKECIAEAEKRGAHIVGFSPFDNPFFRQRKWRDVGYVQNKCILAQRTDLKWNQSNGHPAMEEYALNAAMHLEYGRVLINNFAYPKAGHYEPGGLGPYEERLPGKIAACKDIMERFPGFVRYSSKKAGGGRGGELNVRFHSLNQVHKWIIEMQDLELMSEHEWPIQYEKKKNRLLRVR